MYKLYHRGVHEFSRHQACFTSKGECVENLYAPKHCSIINICPALGAYSHWWAQTKLLSRALVLQAAVCASAAMLSMMANNWEYAVKSLSDALWDVLLHCATRQPSCLEHVLPLALWQGALDCVYLCMHSLAAEWVHSTHSHFLAWLQNSFACFTCGHWLLCNSTRCHW